MWYRFDAAADRLTLALHVQPGAKRTEAAGLHGDALKLRLAAPPVDGKANAALLEFIAETFDVPLRQVALKQGAGSRRKLVVVNSPKHPPQALLGAKGAG